MCVAAPWKVSSNTSLFQSFNLSSNQYAREACTSLEHRPFIATHVSHLNNEQYARHWATPCRKNIRCFLINITWIPVSFEIRRVSWKADCRMTRYTKYLTWLVVTVDRNFLLSFCDSGHQRLTLLQLHSITDRISLARVEKQIRWIRYAHRAEISLSVQCEHQRHRLEFQQPERSAQHSLTQSRTRARPRMPSKKQKTLRRKRGNMSTTRCQTWKISSNTPWLMQCNTSEHSKSDDRFLNVNMRSLFD